MKYWMKMIGRKCNYFWKNTAVSLKRRMKITK